MLSCPLQASVNLGASPKPGTKGIPGALPGSSWWAPEQKHCHLQAHGLAWERGLEYLGAISILPRHLCGRELSEGTQNLRFGSAARAGFQEISVIIVQRAFKGCCNTRVFLFSSGELGQSLGNNCSFCFEMFESLSCLQLGEM